MKKWKNKIISKGFLSYPFLFLRIINSKNKIRQIFCSKNRFSYFWAILKSHGYLLIVLFLSLILVAIPGTAYCQSFGSTMPISYYYTDPLFFSDYGYINSIIEPFYYLGYGYKPPIEGNTLLAWNRYTPFNSAYSAYLLNFIDIPTYTHFGSLYQTTFPYSTLPGAGYPYERFQYPAYSYGSVGAYQLWLGLQ